MKLQDHNTWVAKVVMVLLACHFTVAGYAARAKTEWRTYIQPDGQTLILTLGGDEFFHFYTDMKGNKYVCDTVGVFHLLSTDMEQRVNCCKRRSLPLPTLTYMDWDPDRSYRQLVILVSFGDCDFSMEDPQTFYHALFNEHGYNQRNGVGCVADYFRDQSGGRLNLQFDVYGPIQVNSSVKQDPENYMNLGSNLFREAVQKVIELYPDIDFSVYDWYDDWDGEDKMVSQVVFIYAGYAGNQRGFTDHIWPNTYSFDTITTPDNYDVCYYTATGELWADNTSCGIGTICHEFSHSLGLPDIYPTLSSVSALSIVDEWDLMDGGTVTNKGWCPPNYSPLEKMLMGWLTPVELTKDTVITGLKPISEGGEAYIINHTDDEFYLIENRLWKGWDYGLPGQGLLVYHVLYDKYAWGGNSINNIEGKPNYSIVSADNLSFMDWYSLIRSRGLKSQYVNKNDRLNSILLSSAAYPYATDSTTFVNDCLTDTSLPSSTMYMNNAEGSRKLSKPITNITQNDDGTVSFEFHASNPDGITDITLQNLHNDVIYDLQGRRMPHSSLSLLPPGLYIINGRKYIAQ